MSYKEHLADFIQASREALQAILISAQTGETYDVKRETLSFIRGDMAIGSGTASARVSRISTARWARHSAVCLIKRRRCTVETSQIARTSPTVDCRGGNASEDSLSAISAVKTASLGGLRRLSTESTRFHTGLARRRRGPRPIEWGTQMQVKGEKQRERPSSARRGYCGRWGGTRQAELQVGYGNGFAVVHVTPEKEFAEQHWVQGGASIDFFLPARRE
ncbi:hypothetical protein DFH07DRAFT_773637 [Mycena maculata]|uniref:Uncharacterized protein n=1 Tax=Mycena maculata TaxID=230809 RepID=A0AAD7NC87_9AGAR|nr:hypothetical protein DFH07DRAFT_773637 [Mycena maculata]